MRNLYPFEKLLVLAALGFIVVLMVGNGGWIMAPLFLAAMVWIYVKTGAMEKKRAMDAVAHASNAHVSGVEGTAIAIAYAVGESRPVVQVFADRAKGRYEPDQLRTVGITGDRKGMYRYLRLEVKDADRPEWVIRLDSEQEARQWKERITQFVENGGRG